MAAAFTFRLDFLSRPALLVIFFMNHPLLNPSGTDLCKCFFLFLYFFFSKNAIFFLCSLSLPNMLLLLFLLFFSLFFFIPGSISGCNMPCALCLLLIKHLRNIWIFLAKPFSAFHKLSNVSLTVYQRPDSLGSRINIKMKKNGVVRESYFIFCLRFVCYSS